MENPVYLAIQDEIRNLLYEDLRKSDIKEIIDTRFPDLNPEVFEAQFSNAFCTL